MKPKDHPQVIFVPKQMYDDLKRAGMEIGCLPQQRIPDETFSDYVRRVPVAPK